MSIVLTDPQRRFALHHLMFDRPLSAELAEALQRAVTAGHDNAIHDTGIIEFFCGLYLHFKAELTGHLNGDMPALVQKVFPKHRFGDAGIFPGEVFENAAADGESCDSGVMYSVSYSDELVHLLWTAARLSNAVGKKPSLRDVIAATTLDDDCLTQLRSNGIYLKEGVADFRDVLGIVFHATPHAHESWPRLLTFDLDTGLQPPYTAVIKTPSGGFQPMRHATVKLNGNVVAELLWPDAPVVSVPVNLQPKNVVEFEVDGPKFGSMEITIRGINSAE